MKRMMIEAFEETGIWWLPESPDRPISGTISYSPQGGIKLWLVGTLVSERRLYATSFHPVVHGISENLSAHTITGCQPWNGIRDRNHHGTQQTLSIAGYHVDSIFKGGHIADPEGMLVAELAFGLSNLKTWLDDLDMFLAEESVEEETSRKVLRYFRSVDREVLINGATCQFGSWVGQSISRNSIELKIESEICVTPAELQTLSTIQENFVYPLRQFLDIAVGEPNLITRVEIRFAEGQGYPEHVTKLPIELIVRDTENSRTLDGYDRDPVVLINELINATEAFALDGKIIRDFVVLRESIKATLDLYLLSRHFVDSFPFLELGFVAVVNALESFHNARRESSTYPEDEWQEVRRALKVALPKSWRGEVLQAFDYIKVKKLRPSLIELFEEADPLSRELGEDRKRLIDAIATTRNYFSHYAKELEMGKLEATQAFNAMRGLLAVTEVLILRELGFSGAEAVERVRGTLRSRNLKAVTLPAVETGGRADESDTDGNLTDLKEENVAAGADPQLVASSPELNDFLTNSGDETESESQ